MPVAFVDIIINHYNNCSKAEGIRYLFFYLSYWTFSGMNIKKEPIRVQCVKINTRGIRVN